MNKIIFFSFFSFIFLVSPFFTHAQNPAEIFSEDELMELYGDEAGVLPEGAIPKFESEEVTGIVTRILSDTTFNRIRQMRFEVLADSETFFVDTSESFTEGIRYNLREGDKVFLQVLRSQDNEIISTFLIDVYRLPTLLWILSAFVVLILIIGLGRGFASLIGLLMTVAILFGFIFPQILNGSNPVLITIIGSIVILGVNMHLSHGFSKRTFAAFGSTVVGLLLVFIFAWFFVTISRLSGLTSEESILLYYHNADFIIPSGVLLAGIILGATGVLDDIAITQTETVAELKEANPSLSQGELFKRAMRIGRHHIASTVNTLVLAYVGVALPLLLLYLSTQGTDMLHFLNQEPIAEEVVRTLAGTMGLVLTVPISTLFATIVQKR